MAAELSDSSNNQNQKQPQRLHNVDYQASLRANRLRLIIRQRYVRALGEQPNLINASIKPRVVPPMLLDYISTAPARRGKSIILLRARVFAQSRYCAPDLPKVDSAAALATHVIKIL